jgi:hypothetical protein
LQAGGRRFDPVWLHQADRLLQAPGFADSFASYLIRTPPVFDRRACKLSDIVKRRSIRALRAAVKPRAARYLQAFSAPSASRDASRWKILVGNAHVGEA